MSTLKDIITGRQDSKKFRKDNFGNSGEHSGMTVVYTGRGETGYERRNFDVQHNSERSIRDIITGKETPEITEMQVNYETKHRYKNDGKKIAAIVPKAKKNYDVPMREQFLEYIKKVGTTDTVPSKEQMTQYKAESDMYRDMDMGSKYGNATYEELKKGYKTATDGREKEWLLNRIKESASSEELEDWKKDLEDTYNSDIESIKNDDTKDKGVQYSQRKKAFDDDTSEIESLIEEKRRQETSQKNQKKDELYSDKYKDYDYKKLKTESSNNKLPDEEREWLKNSADEKATSKDLQGELDSIEAEYKELLKSSEEDHTTSERKTITDRLDFIEKRRPKLQNLIEKKIQEENEKKYYYDIVENDVKAATVIQKYYKLNKFNKNGTSYKSANADEAVKYPEMGEKSQDERTKIEQDFYNLEKKGYDTEKLLKYYSRIKEREEAEEDLEYLRNQADKYPISSSFGSMIMNTYGSVEDTVKYAGAGIDKAFGGDGYINPDSTNVAKAQIMREKVSEDMDGLGKFFYNTGMSIGDNLARMPLLALPGGEAMSLALAGTSAGVSSANDVINSGGSLESALWTGAAAGTAEVVFEKISLDKLIDLRKKGTDSVFRAVVNQMKTEGLEEVGTDIANAITDQIINGDMSQLALQYQNYIAQGYSEEEARKQIAFDFASQLGQSFAAGAISGGVLSDGTIAINKISKKKTVSQLGRAAMSREDFDVNELIEEGKKSGNPKAENLARSLEKVVEEKGADKVKAVDVGNLLTLTNSEEITYDYSEDLSELTGTDKQNIIDSNFELNGEEKTSKTSDDEVKYTDTKAFGENFPHGLGAKISKTGERITIVGIKSSSKDFNSDDNTVVLLADNGELYDSDDIRTSVSHFNDLFDYAKNFDTIGARVYLSQYEDYAKRSKSRGKTADIAEYSECFERLYSYGIKGVTYDSIKKSGNFTREINILSAGVAYSAVQSGNNDFKVDTRDKSNKSQKIRMPGESNSISSKVYVDPGSEDSVKVTDEQLAVLQAVADKTGREIVLTDRMGERTGDENANGGYNLNDGKIYINAEVHDSYMLSVSLHEAVHGVASDNPAEYHALCTFITNYLVAKGENLDDHLRIIKTNWGNRAATDESALEELVCQTVMAIATDEAAIKTALSLEENKGILKKVASALKKIAKAAYDFIKGVGVQAHNKQAQPWIDNIDALNELAVRLEKAFESTRTLNEQRANATANTETAQKNNIQSDVKFSYGGPTAKIANISRLDQAIQMENSGKDSESIRKKTDWFRGMDGKWRFEIDDSKMRFYKATKQDIKNTEEYKNNKIRYNGLSHKIANNTATAEQQQKYKAAEKYIKEYETSKKLSDYVSHPELFRAYPQLKEVNFYFDTISAKGAYYPDGNAIVINPTLSQDEQRESVIHEIQHAIQHIEGFADGSTMAQWQKNGADSLTAYNNYRNTAGEIEARDTANRVNLNSEQRKNTRPDIDRKDVVFAENAKISMDDIKNYELDTYSEREIKNWNSNKNIVIYRNNEQLIRFIDNALNNPTEFKKLYFGKISKNLARFIKKETNIDLTGYNLSLRSYEIRKTLINSHGNEEKENLRGQRAITKEDLIHLPEIITHPDKIELSEKLYENKPVIIFSKTINGKISTATYVSSKHHDLSLQTMYSGKNKESLATTPSGNHSFSQTSETLSGTAFNKSLLQNNNNVKHSVDDVIDENSRAEVTQKAINTEYVDVNGKQHSDLRFAVDDTIDNEYLEAVKNNDLETAQKFVDEAAKKNGYTIKAYHGTTNQQEKSTWNDKMKWYDTEYKHFTVFKRQYDEQAGHFFNDDIDNAGGYGSILYSVYLKINKPLVIDCKGQNYASITFDGKEMDTYEWAEYAKKHRYDGVIFKNISDGVGYDDLSRLTTDYVVFESNQIKSSEPITYDDKGNVIPLSKRFNYLVDIRYSKDDTIDSNDKKITAGMSDSERAEILNNKSIEKVTFDYDKAKDFDLDYIENNIKSIVEKPLLEKLGKLGAFKNYKANNIDIDFSFTRNGMKKSLHSQEIYYGESKSDLVKIILSLDELLDKAVLIESHFDKAKGTPKENKRLKQVFVLLNVLEDENNTIPVQFEIKQFIDNNNRLYLAVALTSFKTEEEISVKANTAQEKNQVRTKLGLSPEISIPELISKINIRDRNFLKYIPNVLLTKEQINAKNLAIEEENKKYGRTDYYDEDFSDISEIKLAVDDTISDGMFADGDLFDEDGYIQQTVFERAVKDNPDFALTAVYNHAAKTAETAIKQSRDVKLTYEAYMKIARRLMSRYDISRKLNKDFDEELAQIIKKHTRRMEKGVADFAGELELLVDDCKDALMLSGKLDGEAFKTEREEILSYLRGKTLILTEYAESDVRGDYDTLQNYRKRMFGKINVAYEKNLKNNSKGLFRDSGNNIYINDVIAFVEEHFPHLITDDADDISGYRWLDNLVNNVLKPKFVNKYVDGFYENIDTAAIEMAFDVTTEVIYEKAKLAVSVPNAEHKVIKEITAANKKAEAEQKALLKAKAESYRNKAKEERLNRIKKVQSLLQKISEIKEKNDNQRLKYEAQIEHLKTSLDKTTVILNMGYETIRDQYNSNRERTANINSINNLLAKLEKRYLAPKPKEYIPADIYNPLHDVLTTLIELDGRSKKVGMLAEKMRTLIDKLDAEIVDSKSVLHIPSAFQDALLGYTDEETGKHVDGSLDTVVKIFANSKAKSLKGFSNEEIKQIKDALSQVEAILHSANEIVLAEKRYNAYILSREIEKEIEPVTGTHSKSKVGRALKTGLEMFQNEMNDAKRFARRMVGYKKDSLFVKFFDELNRGQTETMNLQKEWTNKAMQAYSEFSAKELDDYKHKKALTLRGKDSNGNDISIDFTADMLVEIVLEYQDEYAREHMMFSGYHVPNINYLNKKNKNVAYSKDRSFFFVPTKYDIMTIKDYVKKDKLCNTILNLCYNLYNFDMQDAVNEISLRKYGYKLAKVRNYCPITIDTDTVEKGFADVLINRSINSRAFLHMRDKQRHNRLKLMGALDKLGRQIDSVSSWCGLTIPIENFTKVYNMERYDNSFADVDGKRKTFVKDALPGVPLLESVEAENNSENKEIIKITLNNADKISNKLVFDVSEDVTKNYNKKSEGISEYFNKLGNKAINPDLGVIELNKSGAKSTLFHGFGEDKLVAVTAIKDVIEQGKIIDHTTNYKNKNYDRYIISGLGKINGSNCYVSVVIKSYPNNKNMNSKFYLHEVTKIETNSHIMTGTQFSENPVSEFASKEIVPQSSDDFKQNLQNNKPKENNMIYFRSVKENLKLRWGNWADDYISKLMGKLQGATKVEASKLDVLTSNYIRGILTGNLNSAIVQISSYPLAANVVGWKPVAAGLKHIRPGKHTPGLNRVLSDNYKHSVPYDELAKYTPILWYRQQGHNNRDINEINKYKSLGDKSGVLDKLNWIEKMDTIMVDMNYWICYEYVKNELNISPESKEFMSKVAETLEEIINSMMPNSSIMQQGQILRRDNPLLKVFTICKSQVFCMANAIMDSTGEYIARRQALKSAEQSKNEKLIKEAKADLKESKTKYIRTFSSVTMSVVMTVFILNVIKAFVTGKYDKYKDEDGNITASSVGLRMLKDFGSEFTGMFLFGDIIYNFALSCIDEDEKFWGVSYPGIEIINDLFTGINKLINSDERNFLDNLRNIIGTAGLAKGLPIKNMDGLIQGIYNHFVNSAFYDFTPAVNNNGEVTTKKFANTCYNALIDGNKQLYNTYHSQWLKQKKSNGELVDEKYINSKLKEELEDDKEIIAAADAFREGNLDKYEEIVKKYVGLGFKEETVTSAVDSIINEIEKSEQSGQADNEAETEEEEDKATLYTYSDAFEYLKNGDRENYERIEQYLIDNSDKTKKDVQSAMRSASRTDELWKAYFEAQGTLSGGGDPVKLEELKMILTNIYGSWSTAATYGRKYQKRMKKKEREKNK